MVIWPTVTQAGGWKAGLEIGGQLLAEAPRQAAAQAGAWVEEE